MNRRMIDTNAPVFPKSSLYTGSFPSFPTYVVNIKIAGYSIGSFSVPNIAQIPAWIGSLVIYGLLWSLGWVAAVFLYIFEAFDYYTISYLVEGINFVLDEFNNILSVFENVSRFAGPFGIDVAALFMGILLLGIIFIAYLVIKGLLAVFGGA